MQLLGKKAAIWLAATLLTSAGALVTTATPAQASGGCPVNPFYAVSGKTVKMRFAGVPVFKNGPGGSMTVSRSYSGSVTYQVTAGAETEVGAILAKAKVSISASLAKSNSTSATNTYTRKISKGKYGNAKYVSWGKKVTWKKQVFNSSCRIVTISSGTINFPSSKEGWYYWETKR